VPNHKAEKNDFTLCIFVLLELTNTLKKSFYKLQRYFDLYVSINWRNKYM